jgi:hypothetical protein
LTQRKKFQKEVSHEKASRWFLGIVFGIDTVCSVYAVGGGDKHPQRWTGRAMIVWGGFGGSALDTSGVYTLTSTLSLSPTSQSFTASGGC